MIVERWYVTGASASLQCVFWVGNDRSVVGSRRGDLGRRRTVYRGVQCMGSLDGRLPTAPIAQTRPDVDSLDGWSAVFEQPWVPVGL